MSQLNFGLRLHTYKTMEFNFITSW